MLSHRNKYPRGCIHRTPGSRTPVATRPDGLVAHEAAVAHFQLPLPPGGNSASVVFRDVADEGGVSHAHERAASAPWLRRAVDLVRFAEKEKKR